MRARPGRPLRSCRPHHAPSAARGSAGTARTCRRRDGRPHLTRSEAHACSRGAGLQTRARGGRTGLKRCSTACLKTPRSTACPPTRSPRETTTRGDTVEASRPRSRHGVRSNTSANVHLIPRGAYNSGDAGDDAGTGVPAPQSPMASLRLMAVVAHPDDESLGLGATLARYAGEGAAVSVVTATNGEAGRYRGHPQEHP